MAYAALNSLVHTIDGLLNSSRISVAASTQQTLQYAYHHASSLEHTIDCCSALVTELDENIKIEEARKLEDAIEFPLLQQYSESSDKFSLNLHHLTQDLYSFARSAKGRRESIEKLWERKVAEKIEEFVMELVLPQQHQEPEDEDVSSSETEMVGLSDQFLQIRDELIACQRSESSVMVGTIVIWISGMAGIGKTELAKKLFHDPSVMANFECQAFVKVGKEFRLDLVLDAIAPQLNLDKEKVIIDDDLYESFCRILTARKSLIVLDDVWDFFTLNRILKKIEDKESRILVTSRSDARFRYYWGLKMRFLDEEESWEVLKREVFGEEECPPQLVKAGKKIAEKCEGLPLLINAVASELLSKVQKNPEDWNEVAERPNPVLESACDQISEVLLSVYHIMVERFKLCFLYIAVFPQSYIVRRSTIINLWRAERFVGSWTYSELEIFDLLLGENLVVSHKKSRNSYNSKDCRLHFAYWYLSKREAKDKKFMYIINSYADGLDERVSSSCHLSESLVGHQRGA